MTDGLLTVAEVAAIFRVHRATVTGWIRDGKLTAIETPGSSSDRRISLVRRSDVEAFLAPKAAS